MGVVLKDKLPAQSAGGGDSVTVLGVVSEVESTNNQLIRAEAVSPSLVTGVDTDNVTISVRQLRAGVVVATLAHLQLVGGTNLPAETPTPFVLNTPEPALVEGDVIDVLCHQNGAGLALPAGVLVEVEGNFQLR